MKNLFILNIMILFLSIIVVNNIDAQVQSSEPTQSHGTDCKTNEVGTVVDILPAPPFIDPDGDPDDEEEDEDDNPEEETENKRTVMFVHGYQGNHNSWLQASTFLDQKPNRKYNVQNLGYETKDVENLNLMSNNIKSVNHLNLFEKWSSKEKEKNFFIAHSMGGMALRFMQNNYIGVEKPYGGIITFGSGHLGVFAAETKIYQTKKYKDFLTEACTVHLEPLIHGILPNFAHNLNSITNILPLEELSNTVCQGAETVASEFVLDEKIDKNLTVTALSSGQNAYPAELDVKHKLALYGVEEDEMDVTVGNETTTVRDLTFPKFVGSYLSPPSSYDLWEGDASDDFGISFWNDAILNYTNKRDELNDKISNFWWRLFNPLEVPAAVDSRNAFDRSLIWMRDANFQYLELIGGIQNVNITSDQCVCGVWEPELLSYYEFLYPNPGNCSDLEGQVIYGQDVTYAYPSIHLQARSHETDGFVLAESAAAMPGADRVIRMQGSGHFQMRNDSNTEQEFNKMFKKAEYGKYFKLFD